MTTCGSALGQANSAGRSLVIKTSQVESSAAAATRRSRSAALCDPQLGPDDLAPVAGAFPAPAAAEGGDHHQAAPALGVGVRLAGFQVARAVVPRLDDEGLLAGQQAQGDRRPVRE